MNQEITLLIITAASIGLLHTLLGPDHYLPFIVMSKARNWSITKTIWITFLCGLGHVGSSVVIGSVGIAMGIGVKNLENAESFRGNLAAWALMLFGLLYFLWGIYRIIKNKPHKHLHFHNDGTTHEHIHVHENSHDHLHNKEKTIKLTPWILFIIFVFGPCEPLIPILMFPAAKENISGLILVTVVFCIVTILTMITIVTGLSYGLNIIPLGKYQKYTHSMAGLAIFLSGAAIVFLGL